MKNRFEKINEYLIYALIVFISIIAVFPLLRSEFFHFSDEPHIANLYQMVRGFESGQFIPRWAPDMSYGFGYPLFNFYYPLPFYVGALFNSLGFSLIWSFKMVLLIGVPMSGVGMYLWLKQHTYSFNSFVGSVIYMYTPYRAVDLYVRGAIGEATAFVLMPFIAYATNRVVRKKDWRSVGILGSLTGIFILSHNLAPLFFLPWLAIYLLLISDSLKIIAKGITGFALGIIISAYWWIPAFLEKDLLQSQTPFNYIDHFPFIKQLIYSPWAYGASNPGIYDDISFQIGIVNILLILFLIIYIFIKREFVRLPLFFLASILICLLLMNIRSAPFWELTGLANYIQFPWRLLMMTTFLSTAITMFVGSGKWSTCFLTCCMIASIILTGSYFRPSEYFATDDNYFLNRFFANRSVQGKTVDQSSEYINYSEDYLLLPRTVTERPDNLPDEIFMVQGGSVDIISDNPTNIEAKVQLDEPGELEIFVYDFPGWQVYVDDSLVEHHTLSPYGNVGINLPDGVHKIILKWNTTPLRRTSELISFIGVITAILLVIGGKNKNED